MRDYNSLFLLLAIVLLGLCFKVVNLGYPLLAAALAGGAVLVGALGLARGKR